MKRLFQKILGWILVAPLVLSILFIAAIIIYEIITEWDLIYLIPLGAIITVAMFAVGVFLILGNGKEV